jgi:hypothetical protein
MGRLDAKLRAQIELFVGPILENYTIDDTQASY